MNRLLLGLALVTVACASLEPSPVGTDREEIIGGSSDYGADLNVVSLVVSDASGRLFGNCTGSLISPRVVLTAAHCIDGATYQVGFADSYDRSTGTFGGLIDRRPVTKVYVHPKYTVPGSKFDLALLLLESAAPTSISPLPWNRIQRLSARWEHGQIRLVGFGLRMIPTSESNLAKLTGQTTVDAVGDLTFTIFGDMVNICSGDSGGPGLMPIDGVETQVGIASTKDVACAYHASYTRVDRFIPEITAFINDNDPQPTAHCAADGICGWGCTTVDPDCPCAGDGVCGTACDPDDDPDCPEHCHKDGICERTGCPAPDPDCGSVVTGAACTMNNDCLSTLCVPSGSGRICVPACSGSRECPSGFTCSPASTVCLPSDDGGGGCAVGGGGGGGGGLLVLAAALVGSGLGRRRRGVAHRGDLA